MLQFFTLPTNWQATVLGYSGGFFSDIWPLIALIVGLAVVAYAIRFIVGLFK